MSYKFRHYRNLDEDGSIISRSGATLAFTQTDKGFFGSLSFCNPCDNYCKAIGREFSSRFLTHNLMSFGHPKKMNGEVVETVDDTRHFFAATKDMSAFIRGMDTYVAQHGYEPVRKRTVH